MSWEGRQRRYRRWQEIEVCGFVDGRRLELRCKMEEGWNWNDGEEVRAAKKSGRGDGVEQSSKRSGKVEKSVNVCLQLSEGRWG